MLGQLAWPVVVLKQNPLFRMSAAETETMMGGLIKFHMLLILKKLSFSQHN